MKGCSGRKALDFRAESGEMLTLGIRSPFFGERNMVFWGVMYWVLLSAWVVLSVYTLLVAVVSMIRLCDGEFSPKTAPSAVHRVLQAIAVVAGLLAALYTGVFWLCVTTGTIDIRRPVLTMLPCAAVVFALLFFLSWRRDSWDRVRPLLWSALLTVSFGTLFSLIMAASPA